MQIYFLNLLIEKSDPGVPGKQGSGVAVFVFSNDAERNLNKEILPIPIDHHAHLQN